MSDWSQVVRSTCWISIWLHWRKDLQIQQLHHCLQLQHCCHLVCFFGIWRQRCWSSLVSYFWFHLYTNPISQLMNGTGAYHRGSKPLMLLWVGSLPSAIMMQQTWWYYVSKDSLAQGTAFFCTEKAFRFRKWRENQIVEVSISSCIHQSALELFQCAQSRREVWENWKSCKVVLWELH